MAINKNHEFEELNGVKCAIVEKGASPERVRFLEALLKTNGYTVMVVPLVPPKTAPTSTGTEEPLPESPETPASFTIGVTDVTFNPVNAVFGRLLKTADGKVVTLAFWHQKENIPQDEVPYFQKKI